MLKKSAALILITLACALPMADLSARGGWGWGLGAGIATGAIIGAAASRPRVVERPVPYPVPAQEYYQQSPYQGYPQPGYQQNPYGQPGYAPQPYEAQQYLPQPQGYTETPGYPSPAYGQQRENLKNTYDPTGKPLAPAHTYQEHPWNEKIENKAATPLNPTPTDEIIP